MAEEPRLDMEARPKGKRDTQQNRDTESVLIPLWRNRDFMALWTGETVSSLGSSMSFFLFPLVGYTLTGSATWAAAAGTAYACGRVAFRLPAGALVDRLNRRAVLLVSSLSGAVAFGALGLSLVAGTAGVAQLIAVAIVIGVMSSFFDPAEQASLRKIVPGQQLATALSQNEARGHVASLVGPPLGGVLYAVSHAIPFLVDAVTYAVSAIAITTLRTPLPAPQRGPDQNGIWADIVSGLRFLLSTGFFRAVVAFAAIVNFGTGALFLVITVKLLQAGTHPAAIGIVESTGAVAGIVGALLAPTLIKRIPTGRLVIGSAGLLVVAVVPMAFTDNVYVIGALLALALLTNPAGNAGVMSRLFSITPDNMQGRASAALGFAASAFMPLGPLVGGYLLALAGARTAVLVVAALISLGFWSLAASRETRELSTPNRWVQP